MPVTPCAFIAASAVSSAVEVPWEKEDIRKSAIVVPGSILPVDRVNRNFRADNGEVGSIAGRG